jgi:diguanylate cyclase (GGDEF)-like protein
LLVLGGHWSHASEVLESCAKIIVLGLSRARTEQRGRATERGITHALKLAHLGASVDDQQLLAERLVERIAAMFQADRVSIALFSAADQALKIVASTGVPVEISKRARIKPGDWTLGYVFSSSSVLTVSDVRLLPSRSANRARYKTHSFAAAPLVFGNETIGVVSVTDRRDGRSFTSGDRVSLRLVGAAAGAALSAAAARESFQRLQHQATTDSITGLFNRGYLDSRLLEEVERAQREHTELAVLIADIDDFKSINDRFGHPMGDAVLKDVGAIIRSSVRMFDVCARFGGDEFAVLMPNSDRVSALACAERIRQMAAQYVYSRDASFPALTLSVGVAVVGSAQDGAATVVGRADRALYQAKAAGKNAVRGDGDVAADTRPVIDGAGGEWADSSRRTHLPYVLVADPTAQRTPIYSAGAQQQGVGLLVSADASQAARLIQQFGPPLLLVVDLALPEMQHLALNLISNAEREVRVLAFSASRELREFFRASPNAGRIHVLNRDAATDVIGVVMARLLRASIEDGNQPLVDEDPQQRLAESLTKRTRGVVDAAGAAAYVKDPRSGQLRAVVRWNGEESLAHAQNFIPRAIDEVIDRNELVMLGDVGPPLAHEDGKASGRSHALLGTPILDDDKLVGALCVFDDQPLRLSGHAVKDFEELGATAMQAPPNVAAPDDVPSDRRAASHNAGDTPDAESSARAQTDVHDGVPTLLERARGEFEVARELSRARREQRQMSVVLFDVSQRLRQQQRLGEVPPSEEDIANVVDTFVRAVRQSDLPIRWSGNELLLVLPGLAGVEARAVAERVRAAMEAGGQRRVAVSGGVAQLESDEQFGTVVERARAKVAQALVRGHNRVS